MTLALLLSSFAQAGGFAFPVREASAAGSNPITVENAQAGTTSWQFSLNANGDSQEGVNHEIEGYATLSSVNKAGTIGFKVSLSSSAQYTMAIYRMGYYGGTGGRLMQQVGPLSGSKQAACPLTTTTTNFGLVECNWSTAYTLTVPTTWTTGNYLVKLHRNDTGKEKYMTFVVRDDAGSADIVHSMDVSTWQAYNFWGGSDNGNIGYNLYGKFRDIGGSANYDNIDSTRAYAVSFDRPYTNQGETDGAGSFFLWDYPMVRWMESQGYNVTYATSVDIETNPSLLSGRKAFINTGHDEYYSDGMRANMQAYINGGAHMGYFSANNFYFRIAWANNPASGQSQRRIICYKNPALDPVTIRWRDLAPPVPENAIGGVMLGGLANDRQFRVANASNWIYAGTGLVNYVSGNPVTSGAGQNSIAGIVGYEFDSRASSDSSLSSFISYEPANTQMVAHSAVPSNDNGVASFSDAVVYTASSGAIVFSAGTLQWSWGLDDGYNTGSCGCNVGYTNAKSQQITKNIIDKFLSTPTGGGATPAVTLSPTSLTFGNQGLNTTSAAQTVTLTNSGNAALTITSIGLAGANAGDFAQTNTCPLSPTSLAAGASCSFSVTFTPAAAGARSSALAITDNASGSPHTVALSGTGVSAPAVTLNPASLTFSSQFVGTTSNAQTFTLSNSGSAPLTIASIDVTGANAADFARTTTCAFSPGTLAAGGSCTINVTFTPSASGSRAAALTVTDDASDSPQAAPLSGTGTTTIAPAVTLSPASLTFGTQAAGTPSSAQTITLTNSGNATLTIGSIAVTGANAADFAQTNTCPLSPGTLAAGGSCTISVTFTPSTSGSRTASISVTDDATGSPHTAALSGTGAAGPGQYLVDGFESGNLSTWSTLTSTGGSASVQATVVNSGTRAAALTNNASGQYAGIYTDLSGGGHALTYSRFCFRLAGLSGSAVLAQGRDASGNTVWEIDYDAGLKGLDIYFWNGARTRTDLFSPANLVFVNTWYCAEVQLNEATSGHGEVWLNGTSVARTDANLSATNFYSRLYLWNNPAAGTVYHDDVQVANSYNGPVGAGANPLPTPVVTLNPTSRDFGTQQVATTSAAQTVTLSNSGGAPLTITGISLAGTNAADFAQTNTCPLSPSTLVAGGSCTISVTFSPIAAGARSASISVTDNATGSPHAVALSGTATAPPSSGVGFSPASLTFAGQLVGSPPTMQTITLTNTGNAALTISSIAVTGANASDFAQTNTCPTGSATLAAGASCTINVTFSPSWQGARSASVSVTDNATGSPHTVSLTGTGALPAGTYLIDDFEGTLGGWAVTGTGSATVQTAVVNSGTRAAALTDTSGQYVAIAADLTAPQSLTYTRFCFRLAGLSGSTVLAQGRDASGNTVWEVDYDAGLKGLDIYFWNGARVRTDLFSPANLVFVNTWYCAEVQLNAATAGHGQVWLNGTSIASVNADLSATSYYSRLYLHNQVTGGVYLDDVRVASTYSGPVGAGATPLPAPAVTLAPASLTFASQVTGTTSAAQTVTLTNSGNAALTVTSIAVTGANAGDFAQTNTCPLAPATLAAGANCTISVTFTPVAAGSRAASLSVADNAAGSPHAVALTGTGIAPAVTLAPTSLTFANQLAGTTSPAQTVTLTNSGGAPLTVTSIAVTGANAGDFAQTNTCPASPSTLAAGASCTISVTFSPTAAGSRSASVSVADNAAGSPHAVALTGTGAAPAATLAPTSLTFGGQQVGTTSAAQSVTLTNSGNAALTISAIGLAGANAGDFARTTTCPLAPATLAAGGNCTISVTFTPVAAGSRAASVSVADNAAGSPHAVTLTGTATLPAGTYLVDSFENGLGGWSTTGTGSATTQTSVVNTGSGARAAALTNTSGQFVSLAADLSGGPQALTYTRFYVRVTGVSAATVLAQGRDINGNPMWELDYDDQHRSLDIYFWNGARTRYNLFSANNTVRLDTWYAIEVQLNEASAGQAQVWINGTSVASLNNTNLSATNYYSRLYLHNQTTGTVYLDDVRVANAFIADAGTQMTAALQPAGGALAARDPLRISRGREDDIAILAASTGL